MASFRHEESSMSTSMALLCMFHFLFPPLCVSVMSLIIAVCRFNRRLSRLVYTFTCPHMLIQAIHFTDSKPLGDQLARKREPCCRERVGRLSISAKSLGILTTLLM
ncbi:hypothetical protein BCV69DRAFT_73356 [Microstroma glucosiphilum]|uniref:Uncharacterized protein n=1 Tax=Pseudomicrostroma glucosiphilum TaxID=1684307 RepID=A0A316TYT4_9BASI|nr:hypothetical protein BCV69DRAFT_73356 [Pseudomicrostroma glucosiphilum]PWN18429.1 hypothetical protein BCV69DRAFT_73356 [Pseudomicrostroma glucosiphilum]